MSDGQPILNQPPVPVPDQEPAEPVVIMTPQVPSFLRRKFLIISVIILIGSLTAITSLYLYFEQPQPIPPPTQPVEELLKAGKLNCPLDAVFCQMDTNYQESSFSAKLDDESPIYAVFDGTLEKQKQPDKNLTVLVLTNKELNLKAFYYFDDGITIGPVKVNAGEVLGVTHGKPIPALDNKSFVFYLVNTKQKNALIPVTLAHFNNQ